ncbi:10040_t:CDS:2 [Ambispora gerdemannii]|uniref:10040_t:CDS:1 n=1 Tax=Ambispora gerdemannii TaxID=144530 RepID=A0A9N9DDI6_9GLOM|nr:10040_t:CDS:2 [Ambispora gerdemannii]
MDDLVEGMVEAVKGKEDEDLDDSEVKDNNKENNPIQAQLRSQISSLEQKPNKTPQQQADLAAKKKQLAELLKKQNSNATNNAKPSDKSTFAVGYGIIGLVLIGQGKTLEQLKEENETKSDEDFQKTFEEY